MTADSTNTPDGAKNFPISDQALQKIGALIGIGTAEQSGTNESLYWAVEGAFCLVWSAALPEYDPRYDDFALVEEKASIVHAAAKNAYDVNDRTTVEGVREMIVSAFRAGGVA